MIVLSAILSVILALLAARSTIVEEVAAAPAELRAYVGEQARLFLEDPAAEDILPAHLNHAQDPTVTIGMARALLRGLAK